MTRKIVLAATALLATSAAAFAAPPATVAPQQGAAIEASCTAIMGLRQGEYQYAACIDSLRNTAAGMIEGAGRLQAYDACRAKGLAPGSAGLATCMLDSEEASPVQAASFQANPGLTALPQDALKIGKSYFGVTHAVQWRREQYSCAQLGLVPGSAGFTHCVASLDADLQPGL